PELHRAGEELMAVDHAEADRRDRHPRVIGRDPQVAAQRYLDCRAVTVTVNLSDDRRGTRAQRADGFADECVRVEVFDGTGQARDVIPRGKVLSPSASET